MKQQLFNCLTWGVVGSAVLSSVWLAANVPVTDLRAAKLIDQDTILMPLPTEPTAAGPAASAPGNGRP
nr:hypothetical protein [uncultured Roseateles sp.]